MRYSVQVLDLFSGIGGFSLGLKRAGMETIGFCEIDPFCRKVLAKHWPDVTVHTDIRRLDGKDYKGRAEIICGGFPCQPFSQAGKRRGTEDDRHLWPEMLRIISEVRPTWVIGENVIGIVKMELDSILSDLEGEGYQTRAFIIPACGIDAPHKRDRVWIIAHANSEGESDGPVNEGPRPRQLELMADPNSGFSTVTQQAVQAGRATIISSSKDVAYSESERVQRLWSSGEQKPHTYGGQKLSLCGSERPRPAYWEAEPGMGRVVDGIPNRVDRIKGLGNAVVPMVVEVIGNAIMEI
jgi:DNA (cytosine-5)-methyltransferase 1